VAGALVWSSDEFGLGVNAVSEKREDVTTICQVVVDLRQVAGLRLKMRVEGQDDTQDQEILGRRRGNDSRRHFCTAEEAAARPAGIVDADNTRISCSISAGHCHRKIGAPDQPAAGPVVVPGGPHFPVLDPTILQRGSTLQPAFGTLPGFPVVPEVRPVAARMRRTTTWPSLSLLRT